ncbi:MAG TPA: ATP-binding protein, partial [Steroidobacteraceae bacterium]|nr:ATP-binding protein [Steroidobacteraceae bacterium]
HDFNNLLLAISGNARLALEDVGRDHPAFTSLNEIGKASARATDLVRRILAFSARTPRDSASTPLCTGVEEALNLVRVSIPPNITLRSRLCGANVYVNLHTTELQQIIINLVTNAVHAIGDRDGIIEVTADLRDAEARIAVRDNGCGMEPAVRDRVFDPFFTTKQSGQGTGLGLAVVHGLVQGAHGTIKVESEPNIGTTFWISLPVSIQQHSDLPIGDAVIVRGAGERILYVDDDESVVLLVTRALNSLGYNVTGFTDSLQAVQAIEKKQTAFDVVVTDLSMPGPNGFDIAAAVKRTHAHVPVILTSGFVREEDRARAITLGIEHVILKPNTIDELVHILDQLCDKLRTGTQSVINL